MSEKMNFKAVEKKTFQSTMQDGLLEIFFGLYLLAMSLTPILGEVGIEAPGRYLPVLIVLLIGAAGLRIAKKRVTEPRLGRVKFNPERKKRKIIVITAFSVLMLILVILMLFLSVDISGPGWERVGEWLPAVIYGLLVFAVFLILHVYLNMPRALLFGGLIGASLPITAILDVYANVTFPYAMIVSGLVFLIVGIVLLTRFLRLYDVPAEESMHDAA